MVKNDFMKMLSQSPSINSNSVWIDVERKIRSDTRYEAAVTDSRRREWFMEYLQTVYDVSL